MEVEVSRILIVLETGPTEALDVLNVRVLLHLPSLGQHIVVKLLKVVLSAFSKNAFKHNVFSLLISVLLGLPLSLLFLHLWLDN